MTKIEELKARHGQEVSLDFIKSNILSNLRLTKHSIQEMRNRTSFVDLVVDKDEYFEDGTPKVNFGATIRNIRKAIDNYILAYINTDGSINVALSDYDYFVFAYNEKEGLWNLVTFKEMSWYGNTIQEKHHMAIVGFDRKLHNGK